MIPMSRNSKFSVLAAAILLSLLTLCFSGCVGPIIAKQKVREGFEYLNQRDIPKFLSLWDDGAIFIYPGNVRASGTMSGKQEVQKWFQHLMDEGPSVHFSIIRICVEDMADLTGANVIAVEWENTVTNRMGKSFLVHGVSVIKTKSGKITHVRDYISDAEKLSEVWDENS